MFYLQNTFIPKKSRKIIPKAIFTEKKNLSVAEFAKKGSSFLFLVCVQTLEGQWALYVDDFTWQDPWGLLDC